MGLRVVGTGHLPVERAGVRFDGDAELVVVVETGARLRGRVQPPEALAELRRLAQLPDGATFPPELRPNLRLQRIDAPHVGWPRRQQARTDADAFAIADDGSFDVAGLPAGSWRVQLHHRRVNEHAHHSQTIAAGTVLLEDGATAMAELDLQALLPGTIEALVFRDGAPLANSWALLERDAIAPDGSASRDLLRIDTDAGGRFHFVGRPGAYALRRSAHADDPALRAVETVTVVRGTVAHQTFTLVPERR
jgi:hypothetical protein